MRTSAPGPDIPLRDLLVRDLAKGAGPLPMLPRGAQEALALAQSTEFEFVRVTRLLERDPPLAARVLAVANSALYARGAPISSVGTALVRLGVQATKDVLFQAVYSAMLFDVPGYRDLIEATFRHGVVTARIGRELAPRFGVPLDVAFLAGLLHNIGEARCWKILAKRAPGSTRGVEALAAVRDLHTSAGTELAREWKLPTDVVETCEFHHVPGDRPVAKLIHLAEALAHYKEAEENPLASIQSALGVVGWDESELPALVALAQKHQSNVATV